MNALFDSFGLSLEQISGLATSLLAVLLTLATMSRLLRENLFSRLAQLLFVGVAAGYAVGLAWWHILWPRLVIVMADPLGQWPLTLAMALGLLLLARGFRPASTLGDAPVSILLGVGVGLALVGAVRGTLVPQVLVAMWGATTPTNSPRWIGIASPIILTLVTVATLAALPSAARAWTAGRHRPCAPGPGRRGPPSGDCGPWRCACRRMGDVLCGVAGPGGPGTAVHF